MGRRSVNTTKSGKFMNPTDQARKEARKKELKKNKKQRLLVRTAVLKNKDPGQIISELDKLDEIEYNPTQPPSLAEKVLKDKRKKLRETLERVMKLYQKEDPSYWSELKRIEQDYERRRFHRIQFYESVKQAENASIEDIPLPDMIPGAAPPAGSSSFLADIPLPGEESDTPEVHGILKKPVVQAPVALPPPVPTFQGREPPGVPPGPPPSLSDMEDLSDDDDEEEEMEVETAAEESKPKSVRFQVDSDSKDHDSEMDRFMKELEEETKQLPSEEDLQPPGTESESDIGKKPTPKAASSKPPPKPTAAAPEPTHPPPPEASDPKPPTQETPPVFPGIRPPHGASAPPPAQPPPPPRPFFPPPPPPGLALGGRMRFPPPPPMPMHPIRPGFNMPPGRPPFGAPRFRPAARPAPVFSSAPQIVKSDTKIVSETMIQAKPQIRSLSADVTRFVPSVIKQKKDDLDKPKRHEYQIGQSQAAVRNLQQQSRVPPQSKDDAYAEFIKAMKDFM